MHSLRTSMLAASLALLTVPANNCNDQTSITFLTNEEFLPYACSELPQFITTHGVTDDQGIDHPGYLGWTNAQFKYGPFEHDRIFASSEGYYCHCNGHIYPTLNECLPNCQATLACFTDICKLIGGQVCIRTSRIKVQFQATTVLTISRWDPNDSISGACAIEKLSWEKLILNHEKHHAEDIVQIVREANFRWQQPKIIRSCAPTEMEADSNLRYEIAHQLRDEISHMEQELTDKTNAFHATPQGGPFRNLNCTICNQ